MEKYDRNHFVASLEIDEDDLDRCHKARQPHFAT
jgi:hypothetical protein